LLRDTYDLLVIVRKGDPLDGRRELPHEEAFARLYGPQPHFVVGRARDEEARLCCWAISKAQEEGMSGEARTVDVYCPNRAVVSVVGTEALSIVREPDIDDVVFGTGK
jgi:hypothetical protein